MSRTEAAGVRCEKVGAAGEITLDRPERLHVTSDAMRDAMFAAYERWASDPEVYAILIASSGGPAFSAGGDLLELTRDARSDPARARASLAREYSHNWRIDRLPKPHVALIDGLVMGSGVGFTVHGTHRVAGEAYAFAMPEVGVGFFPDVGATHILSHLPGEVGTYLALTGRRVGRADAYHLGLVTHCIDAAHFDTIRRFLERAEPVDAGLDALHRDPGPPPLDAHRESIARAFSADTVEGILARLRAERGRDADWARAVAAEIETKAPVSLKVALRQMREGRHLDLRQALMLEYRLGWRMIIRHDLHEGVRALLIDKDGAPQWDPASLAEVSDGLLDSLFAPLAEGDELALAPFRLPEAPGA